MFSTGTLVDSLLKSLKMIKVVTEQTNEICIEPLYSGRLLAANGAFGETGWCRQVVEVWLMERSSEVRMLSCL